MSQEDVEIVGLAYERLSRGDVEGLIELLSEDLEFHDLPTLPGAGVFIGRAGFRAWYSQLLDAFEDLHFEVQEFIDRGDRVLVDTLATGRGKGSGANVEMPFVSVWTLRDDKLASHTAYSDRAQAFEAVGAK